MSAPQTPPGPPVSIALCIRRRPPGKPAVLRRKIQEVEGAAERFQEVWGDFTEMVTEGDPYSVTLGDVDYMSDELASVDMAPWEIHALMQAVVKKMTAELRRAELRELGVEA